MITTRRGLIATGIGTAAELTAGRFYGGRVAALPLPPGEASVDPLQLVNPEFRKTLEAAMARGLPPPLTTATLQQVRVAAKARSQPMLPTPEVSKRTIPGPKGAPDVVVYVSGAVQGMSKPAVLHMHGGGYVSGSAADNRREMQELVRNHDCVAVTVE